MHKKPILCLDFDGVLHSYTSGWRGAHVVPDPAVPGAVQFVVESLEHFDVQVYSSRSEDPKGITAMKVALARWIGAELDDFDRGAHIAINQVGWPTSKPPAMVTIDDRAIQFTGKWPSVDALRNFQPWNKLPPAKPDWVERAAWVADEILTLIGYTHGGDPDLEPQRADSNDPCASLELPHLMYMALELRDKKVDGETKACRWLGWLQAGVVMCRLATLEDMKELNLKSGITAGK